jgi:hypothetical protein
MLAIVEFDANKSELHQSSILGAQQIQMVTRLCGQRTRRQSQHKHHWR